MRTYTLHVPTDSLAGEPHGLDRALLVPDGFCTPAFAFGPLWFFVHRLWIAGASVLALLIATALAGRLLGLTTVAGSVVTVLVMCLVGLEASSLRRWTYARKGRPARDAVVAGSAEEAEVKAMTRWLDGAAPVRPGPTPYQAHPGRSGDAVIGMFPFSEAGRP